MVAYASRSESVDKSPVVQPKRTELANIDHPDEQRASVTFHAITLVYRPSQPYFASRDYRVFGPLVLDM